MISFDDHFTFSLATCQNVKFISSDIFVLEPNGVVEKSQAPLMWVCKTCGNINGNTYNFN